MLRDGAGPAEGATLIHVEAGVRIRQLLRDLAAIGHALPTMGSGGCQTLAGAISTGTHNSDAPRAAGGQRARHPPRGPAAGRSGGSSRRPGCSPPARCSA